MHSVIADSIDVLAPDDSQDDPLRTIIRELGGAPSGGSTELGRARAEEVALTLSARVRAQDGKSFPVIMSGCTADPLLLTIDPAAGTKALFNEAKRRVLAILKVHHGADLEAVLSQPVTAEDEDTWARIVQEEEEDERKQAYERGRNYLPPANNLRGLSFRSVKRDALKDIVQLRAAGLVRKEDRYQALLDAIAMDIKEKRELCVIHLLKDYFSRWACLGPSRLSKDTEEE